MKHPKTISLFVVTWTTMALLSGCGSGTGYLVTPIPHDQSLQETVISPESTLFVSSKVAIVDVDGMLMNKRGGLLGTNDNPVSDFVEKIDKAQQDDDVRAVVLRINSPGGGVCASDIMYQRVMTLRRKRHVPVVAIIEDVGASGAYYIASSADTILAHPAAITGSIGVIVQTVSFAGTMRLLGIDAKAITSGPYKDMVSPLKPLDEKDQVILKGVVADFYTRFIDVVAASRKGLTRDDILKLADGRIYTGDQAKANGLVDGLGYMDDAIQLARKLAGVSKSKVVIYGRPWSWRPDAYASSSANAPAPQQVNLININAGQLYEMAAPQFLYLWTGSSGGK